MEQQPVNEFVKWADTVRWMRWTKLSRMTILVYQECYWLLRDKPVVIPMIFLILAISFPFSIFFFIWTHEVDLTVPPEYNEYVQRWKQYYLRDCRDREQPRRISIKSV